LENRNIRESCAIYFKGQSFSVTNLNMETGIITST